MIPGNGNGSGEAMARKVQQAIDGCDCGLCEDCIQTKKDKEYRERVD